MSTDPEKFDELVGVSYRIVCECWTDGTVKLTGEPKILPAEVFFNCAATMVRMLADKTEKSIDDVMDHLQDHVDQARQVRKN